MKAILIDPFTKTVSAVETDGKLHDIYRLIGCTTIDAAYLSDGRNCIYVDDEGLLHDEPLPVFRWQGFEQPLPGRGLLVGMDRRSGENCDTDISIGVAYAHVTFPAIIIDEITTHQSTLDDGTFLVRNVPHFKRTGKD